MNTSELLDLFKLSSSHASQPTSRAAEVPGVGEVAAAISQPVLGAMLKGVEELWSRDEYDALSSDSD